MKAFQIVIWRLRGALEIAWRHLNRFWSVLEPLRGHLGAILELLMSNLDIQGAPDLCQSSLLKDVSNEISILGCAKQNRTQKKAGPCQANQSRGVRPQRRRFLLHAASNPNSMLWHLNKEKPKHHDVVTGIAQAVLALASSHHQCSNTQEIQQKQLQKSPHKKDKTKRVKFPLQRSV